MVRYHGKGRKPGINDSASMDASQSSIGVKIQANSMAVEQSCEASLTTPNSRPHYATCRNSVTCFLELRSTKLQTPANLSRSKDEADRSVNQDSQEHEISWFEHNVGDQSAAILGNLQPESGGNVREVRGLWKLGAAPLCGKSSASTGRDPISDFNSSLGSLASSEIVLSRRDSDSFRHEFSTKEFSKYTKYFSSGQYPLVSWEPESKHVDLMEHETTDKKRKLEPIMENFSGDNELNNTNSTLKDSDILHAHEGTSMSSLEDQATMQEAPRSFARSEFKFARVPVLNRIRRKLTNMPTVTEIEEFFEENEKQHQTSFMARYNYDLVNDVPLKGRFEWEKFQQ